MIFPLKPPFTRGFSMAMLNNQRALQLSTRYYLEDPPTGCNWLVAIVTDISRTGDLLARVID
jgi:hypothetical protein